MTLRRNARTLIQNTHHCKSGNFISTKQRMWKCLLENERSETVGAQNQVLTSSNRKQIKMILAENWKSNQSNTVLKTSCARMLIDGAPKTENHPYLSPPTGLYQKHQM